MRNRYTDGLKHLVRPLLYRFAQRNRPAFDCPVCGYHGAFKDKVIDRRSKLLRVYSKCPGCSSNERHRMMHLVLDEILDSGQKDGRSMLHIAPEACLKPKLQQYFGTYHSADLFKTDVDFNEDIQAMSFPDASYDAVLVSRVLTIPPDLPASLNEMRRVLRKGGIAIVAEIYKHDQTLEYGEMIQGRSREIGLDLVEQLAARFEQVDCFYSDRYDARYQLSNRMVLDGQPLDTFPQQVRIPGLGFKDLVVVCRA